MEWNPPDPQSLGNPRASPDLRHQRPARGRRTGRERDPRGDHDRRTATPARFATGNGTLSHTLKASSQPIAEEQQAELAGSTPPPSTSSPLSSIPRRCSWRGTHGNPHNARQHLDDRSATGTPASGSARASRHRGTLTRFARKRVRLPSTRCWPSARDAGLAKAGVRFGGGGACFPWARSHQRAVRSRPQCRRARSAEDGVGRSHGSMRLAMSSAWRAGLNVIASTINDR